MNQKNNVPVYFLLFLLVLFISNAKTSIAQTKKDVSQWKQLFNGKDLTGWKHVGGGQPICGRWFISKQGWHGFIILGWWQIRQLCNKSRLQNAKFQ